MQSSNYSIIVTGTDPTNGRGGVAIALEGYIAALSNASVPYKFVATHHATAPNGKWLWLLKALPIIWKELRLQREKGNRVIIYAHAGAGVSLFRQSIVLALGRLLGAKSILQLHAFEVDGYLDDPLKKIMFNVALFPASAVSVVAPWWRSRLENSGIEKRLFVIPNPLPTSWEERLYSAIDSKKKGKEVVILTMTRLEPGKGVDLVIGAMPHLPHNVRLIIGGDGSCLGMYKNQARELELGARIQFTGWVSGDEKRYLFEKADLFCLPTSYDSFGMGFLEAMANGLPIIALDWGPISDIVPNGQVGFLIDSKDSVVLAESIERMLDIDLRRHMAIQAKQWVSKMFISSSVENSLRLMFEEILAG